MFQIYYFYFFVFASIFTESSVGFFDMFKSKEAKMADFKTKLIKQKNDFDGIKKDFAKSDEEARENIKNTEKKLAEITEKHHVTKMEFKKELENFNHDSHIELIKNISDQLIKSEPISDSNKEKYIPLTSVQIYKEKFSKMSKPQKIWEQMEKEEEQHKFTEEQLNKLRENKTRLDEVQKKPLEIAKKFYDALKCFAKEAEFYSTKTGTKDTNSERITKCNKKLSAAKTVWNTENLEKAFKVIDKIKIKLHMFKKTDEKIELEKMIKFHKEALTTMEGVSKLIVSEFVTPKDSQTANTGTISANSLTELTQKHAVKGNIKGNTNNSSKSSEDSKSSESLEEKKGAKGSKENKSPEEKKVVIENVAKNVNENKLPWVTVCKGCDGTGVEKKP